MSVLGDERSARDSLEGLSSSRGYLQARVGSELRLKHTPQLDFRYDDSVDRGMQDRGAASGGRRSGEQHRHSGAARDGSPSSPAIRRFLLTTHENPDGDALGSLLAMHEMLKQLGKDSVMFMSADDLPLPFEYRHLPLSEAVHELPEDVHERTLVFLDCGNMERMPVDFQQDGDTHILNIDHHHDNTRFGTTNLVVGNASCTAEILYSLTKDLGIEITPAIAYALYVGLVTDTGRFQYENTTAHVTPDGRGPHRQGRGRAPNVPPALRERADREAPAARARPFAAWRDSTTDG